MESVCIFIPRGMAIPGLAGLHPGNFSQSSPSQGVISVCPAGVWSLEAEGAAPAMHGVYGRLRENRHTHSCMRGAETWGEPAGLQSAQPANPFRCVHSPMWPLGGAAAYSSINCSVTLYQISAQPRLTIGERRWGDWDLLQTNRQAMHWLQSFNQLSSHTAIKYL